MNPRQRQMIKEAYQAGYQEALDEGFGKLLAKAGKFLKKLFKRGDGVVDDVTPTTPAEVLNKIDDLSKQLDDLDYKIPDIPELMKDKYGVGGTINVDKVDDMLSKDITLDRLLGDLKRRKRMDDFADELGLDPNDLDIDGAMDDFDGFDPDFPG